MVFYPQCQYRSLISCMDLISSSADDRSSEVRDGQKMEKVNEGGMYLDEQRRWACVSYGSASMDKADIYVLPECRIEQDRCSRNYLCQPNLPSFLSHIHSLQKVGWLKSI
jgi:hypothetical protein